MKLDDKFRDKIILQDETKIGQILVNLIDNAVKFTQKGEILISADMVRLADE